MAETTLSSSVWRYNALFLPLIMSIWLIKWVPAGAISEWLPNPNLITCIIFAWIIRRPECLPTWLLAATLLIEDLLFLRPPGLWAAIVVIAAEFLRSRSLLVRELNFISEWALVTVLMFFCLLSYQLALIISMTPTPNLAISVLQVFFSSLFYPPIVWLSVLVLRLRKPAPGERDNHGKPL